MTGMKEGAGEDPFAEDTEAAESRSVEQTDQDDTEKPTNTMTEAGDMSNQRPQQQEESIQIPYKFRRDSVHDGRDRVPLFLQPDTKSAERDALRELEERFDDDVSLTDLREALMIVGIEHLDEAKVHLKEWGYGMTFDE